MRQAVPTSIVVVLLGVLWTFGSAVAQDAPEGEPDAVEGAAEGELAPPSPEPPPEPPPSPDPSRAASPVEPPPAAPPPTPVTQAVDAEVAGPSWTPEPEPEPAIGEGLRLYLQVQTNARVGQLVTDADPAGFDFDRATVAGVPDAFVGLRAGRFSTGLGITWTRIDIPFEDPCDSDRSLEDSETLFGFIPTVRYDVLTTTDGRGRFDAGLGLPILISSSTRETVPVCGADPEVEDRSDGLYGLDLMLSGRYHIWPALSVGAELGFSYLVFDFDADPTTGDDRPSITTLTFYSALTLAIEVPL
jgi:hypothetical protein